MNNSETHQDEVSITISWHIDDVLSVDSSLTHHQAMDVLRAIKRNHDATQGVNWDTIQSTIRALYPNQ